MSRGSMVLNSLYNAYVDSAGWAAGLMAPYGIAYPQSLASAAANMNCQKVPGPPQQEQQHACWKTPAEDCSTKAASDTLTWSVQQHLQPAGTTAWTIAGHQVQQPKDVDDAEADVWKSEQPVAASACVQDGHQRNRKQHRQVHRDTSFTSFTSGQISPAAAVTAGSGSHGICAASAAAAFTAAAREAHLQSSASNHSGSFVSPAALMSPAAFVHNAQQMLLQQQQQFQQLQQQQMLLELQQQHAKHVKQQQCSQQLCGGTALTRGAAAGSPAAGRSPQEAEEACSPFSMRAALGDRAFFSVRSLLMKQQETFVQQLYELHRLVRVQQMACSEVQDKYHALTEQYGREAAVQVQCSQSTSVRTASKPTFSAVTTAAAAAAAPEKKAIYPAGQQRCFLACARPTILDDRGAAAVPALPVHAVLLGNLPSSMRAAVSAPATSDCAALNPARFYVRQSTGIPRPVAVSRGRSKGTVGSAAAAVATAAPTVSEDVTVQMDDTAAAAAQATSTRQSYQQQHQQAWGGLQRQSQPSSSSRATSGLDRPLSAACAAVPGRPSPSRPPLSPSAGGLRAQQQQQMPPPPPMLPELAAQHVAAAAAQHQHLLLQQQQSDHHHHHQQQVDAAGDGRAAAAGLPAAAGLNVFRPMPQINPTFASRFLAGGAQRASPAAMPVPRFDPHSYWMKKHYGAETAPAASSGSQQVAAGKIPPAPAAAAAATSTGASAKSAVLSQRAQPAGSSLRAPSLATKQQQQQANSTAGSSRPEMDAAAAAAAPRPVVQWWQDAAATFGEVGLLHPNTQGLASTSQEERGLCSGDRSGSSAKRTLPKYNMQQLPHKKRVKLAAVAGEGWNMGGGYAAPGHHHDQGGDIGCSAGAAQYGHYNSAAAAIGCSSAQLLQEEGAFRPVVRQSISKERSRVRSNHVGSSRQGESVCSDNSASSIDNPNASVAAGAVHAAELGPDADGVSLLLHMGQHAGTPGAAQAKVANTAVSHETVAAPGLSGQATARSAAALLLSLSGSFN